MRPLSGLALLAAFLLTAGTALAASPVGTWTVDKAALETSIRQHMQAAVAKLPPERRAKAQAMLAQQQPGTLAEGIAGTAEFRPDGSVVYTDGDGEHHQGHWTITGDQVHGQGEDGQGFTATLDGDTMRLKAEHDGAPSRMEILLHRQ